MSTTTDILNEFPKRRDIVVRLLTNTTRDQRIGCPKESATFKKLTKQSRINESAYIIFIVYIFNNASGLTVIRLINPV